MNDTIYNTRTLIITEYYVYKEEEEVMILSDKGSKRKTNNLYSIRPGDSRKKFAPTFGEAPSKTPPGLGKKNSRIAVEVQCKRPAPISSKGFFTLALKVPSAHRQRKA